MSMKDNDIPSISFTVPSVVSSSFKDRNLKADGIVCRGFNGGFQSWMWPVTVNPKGVARLLTEAHSAHVAIFRQQCKCANGNPFLKSYGDRVVNDNPVCDF